MWPRTSAGDHMDRSVDEELVPDLWRVSQDAARYTQPVGRGLQDTASVPLEMTETGGLSSVIHVLGERGSKQNTGQGNDGRRTERSGYERTPA